MTYMFVYYKPMKLFVWLISFQSWLSSRS